jgi:hypothetical protein
MLSRRRRPGLARLLLVTAGCWLSVAACGYQPYGAGSLPPEVQPLYFAPLSNGTLRPGLQGLVGAAILQRLQGGRVHQATQEAADAVLGGTLTAYENIPVAFTQADVGRRFRVRIWLAMQLADRGGEKVLLREDIYGEAYYTTGATVTATNSAQDVATQRAAEDLAARVVTRLIEGL